MEKMSQSGVGSMQGSTEGRLPQKVVFHRRTYRGQMHSQRNPTSRLIKFLDETKQLTHRAICWGSMLPKIASPWMSQSAPQAMKQANRPTTHSEECYLVFSPSKWILDKKVHKSIWTELAIALQLVAVRRSTGNNISGHYFHHYFLFFFFTFLFRFSRFFSSSFFVVTFSHRRTPSAMLDKAGGEVLQAVRHCRRWASAPGAAFVSRIRVNTSDAQ